MDVLTIYVWFWSDVFVVTSAPCGYKENSVQYLTGLLLPRTRVHLAPPVAHLFRHAGLAFPHVDDEGSIQFEKRGIIFS